ncbi:MAG: 3-chloro-4-hydroxyphenylacetate reductive dehalogenase precursor [Chloroflexi bacterium ADurb.Bin180]|nr:MAG: 3-chloro-4-hydroxyphenylacetate reductive dehalogenase precursor [Chloroflexi bacterium ADurb.Bin180]
MPKLTNELTSLQRLLREGTLSRRDFVRRLLILGVSAGSAELLASCAPAQQAPVSPATPTHPPLHSSYGPTPTDTPLSAGGNLALGATPPAYPTYTPAPESAYPSPTATPVMWEAGLWMCPLCKGRFGAEGELVEHLLSAHVSKVPGVRVVEEPTYRRYLNEEIARFDQRNIIFARMMWDREYIARAGSQAQRQWRESGEELAQGRAVRTGAIWVDDSVGSLAPQYGGFSGHVRGFGGLYDWDDAVAPQKSPIGTPEEMTVRVKEAARYYGADLVGVTEINPLWVYSHYYDRETGAYGENETGYKYAIMIGIEMDFGGIRQSPGWGASAATALAYSEMGEVVAKLAKYIRTLGYEAVPSGNDTTQNIPLAIDAGLGELGRLGLLLTPEYGARQRLCKVLTNLPLVADKPIEFGMQRFCETCMACAHACPAKAIPKGERSLERTSISNRPGIKRWHVNVENCYLFWRQNGGVDCSNCVAACPWSQQNRPWL